MSVSAYLTKGGERRWRVRYSRPDGSRTDKRGFVRKKDALLWEADHVTVAKARGAYVDPAGARVATVGGLWESWIARKRLVLSPSYLDDVEGAWRKYVEPFWGAASIGNVTRPGVQRWVSDMAEGRVDGRPKSASVVLRAHGVLAGILDDAVSDGLVASNPARKVSLPRKPRRTKHQYLTAPQLFALARECGRYEPLILTLGLTGLRWGEATGLLVGDVGVERRRMDVSKSATQVRRRIVVGAPKTGELRTVVFPSLLLPMLDVDGRDPGEILFLDPSSESGYVMQVDSPRTGSGWFTKACDRAGVPRMTVHDLRHTAASLMVRSGANVKAVQRQLGHASAAMTLDVYSDLFDDDLTEVGERLDSMLSSCDVGTMWARDVL